MQSATSVDALFNNDYNDYFTGNNGFTETTIISEGMREYYHDYWNILHLIGYLCRTSNTFSKNSNRNII